MCGISGIVNFNNLPVEEPSIRKMMKVMKHRGPNDDGIFMDSNIGFGFVRLSILDLSEAGHQPMFGRDKKRNNYIKGKDRYVIVFNGEIFNYLELRAELQGLGHSFKTATDTEVLLTSYIEWDEKCLEKINAIQSDAGSWFSLYNNKINIEPGDISVPLL